MSVSKTIANIYIDVDVKERHKAAGTNISAACNEFLKTYFQDEESENVDHEKEIQLIRAKLAKANASLEVQKQKEKVDDSKKQKERLSVAVVSLRKLHVKKQGGSLIAGEEFRALFDATMEEFGLTRQVLADKVY